MSEINTITTTEIVTEQKGVPSLQWSLAKLGKFVEVRQSKNVIDCWLMGKALFAARKKCAQGEWGPWQANHCPELSEKTIERYKKLADGMTFDEIKNVKNLRQAYEFLGIVKPAKIIDAQTPAVAKNTDIANQQLRADLAATDTTESIDQGPIENDQESETLASLDTMVSVIVGNSELVNDLADTVKAMANILKLPRKINASKLVNVIVTYLRDAA